MNWTKEYNSIMAKFYPEAIEEWHREEAERRKARYLTIRGIVRGIFYTLLGSIFLALSWVSIMVLWAYMTRG